MNPVDVYQEYLKERRNVVDHPIRIGSKEALQKRNDRRFFKALYRKLIDHGIKKKDLRTFMKANRKRLKNGFLVQNLLDSECISYYNKYKKRDFKQEYLLNLQKQCRFIDEYIYDNDMTLKEYFQNGEIPQAVKHWKNDKIDELFLVIGGSLKGIKNNRLLRMYTGEKIFDKISIIKNRINESEEIKKVIRKNLQIS